MTNLNTLTPEEILKGYNENPEQFAVGQTKDITLKNGEKAILVISDFNHYEMKDGTKAPITFNFYTLLANDRRMNERCTNLGGWKVCRMRRFLNGEFLEELLPDEWLPFIASVKIETWNGGEDNELTETFDKVFLNSEIEVQGRTVWSREGEGQPLALFKEWRNRIIRYHGKEYGWWRWLRSPYSDNIANFCSVRSGGFFSCNGAHDAAGVAPCFCISNFENRGR